MKGRQLFEYGRAGEEVERPEREVVVKSLKFLKLRKINSMRLLTQVERRICKVKGDFRQKEILKIWRQKLRNKADRFFVANFKIKCSSGTYVRSIADSLGERVGIPALAFSIKRNKVGKWRQLG